MDELIGWRPIATAPKDGTEFLAWNGDDFGVLHWQDDSRLDWKEEQWEDQSHGEYMSCMFPTHWMPLETPLPREEAPIAMSCRREGELFFLEVTVQGHTIGVDLKIPESDLSLPAADLAKRYVAPSLHAISAAFARMES